MPFFFHLWTGGGAAAGAVAGAAAGAAAVAFGVLPLAKKSKIKLLAKLEETASAEFSNGQIKKSSILATVSVCFSLSPYMLGLEEQGHHRYE